MGEVTYHVFKVHRSPIKIWSNCLEELAVCLPFRFEEWRSIELVRRIHKRLHTEYGHE